MMHLQVDPPPNAFQLLPQRQRYGLYGLVMLAVLIVAMAGAAWVAAIRAANPDQPLSITACTPETYVAPVGADMGPPQDECDRWFALRGDEWPADEPIRVVGQVCNGSSIPVAYQVSVAFVPVSAEGDSGGKFNVIDTPITYDPGCQEPYDFPFLFPESLYAGASPGADLGQWRVVGTARPVDNFRYVEYQWDSVATVNYVAP